MSWWRSRSLVPLEGRRGEGEHAGEFGLQEFSAGVYPSCSVHGAMNRVSTRESLWRCLAEGCNIGCQWL